MSEGYDWLMKPIEAGMCLYESVKDGSVSLLDIARMNEALAVRSENERRFRENNKR